MGNGEHFLLVKKGAPAVEQWRQENPGVQLDLTWADLSKVILSGLDLSHADLRWSNLSKANLKGTDLSNADLSEANLSEAVMVEANLSQAKLFLANLKWTNLSGANLVEADLSGASLIETELDGADLSNADFSNAVVERVELKNAKGCQLSDKQRERNWKVEPVVKLSRGHKIILFSFLTFLLMISPGFFMGPRLDKTNPTLNSIMEIVIFSAFAILYIGIIAGCVYIAMDKGHEGIVGFILGMSFFLVGLLIVTLLPDKTKKRMRRRAST
ncbi:MAG: pentapeptide repeat-containing protein [Planctomycetaceae bacterium]|nr:pentapeptide repeat-containing protein [Planctomycetaceae bacterium]